MLQIAEKWKTSFPGAGVGILVVDHVTNPEHSAMLDEQKRMIENELRSKYSNRSELVESPILDAYIAYYKKFAKTYHVQQQMESVIFKSRVFRVLQG